MNFCSSFLLFSYDRLLTKNNLERIGLVLFYWLQSILEASQRIHGRKLKARTAKETRRNAADRLAPPTFLSLLSFIPRVQLLVDNTGHRVAYILQF